ncbi:hypothetical protein Poli38472_011888 [Pythium oligandrum]|uniref:Uncharacterized protein n=1 Tax=Pythium oligandrum TaxID=41045 RepID=A0A8K1C8A2_PYTOL|nr:hypothetical protein Poli38472_011888 [Pythium oligandrum]|eukprot:TMW58300.1 hypothetical protein Poli38472_011888 [Pythium oligandrum]
MAEVTTGVSAYEAKRLQRIQANKVMLQSLGIEPVVSRDAGVKPRVQKPTVLPEDRRRSVRLQRRSSEVEAEDEKEALPELPVDRRVRARRVVKTEFKPLDLPSVEEPTAAPGKGLKRLRQSCSLLEIDLSAFHDRWLGKQIWPKGKQTIMQGLCPSQLPVFSKMSGIQSWQNAIVLFVNVLGVSGYENVFSEAASGTASEPNAVYFRWFAQNRQHEETPVIQRLCRAVSGAKTLWLPKAATRDEKASKHAPRDPVLLFLRHVDGPYIYCGRLGYLGHLAESRPLEFRWQLLDVDAIQWTQVKQLIDAEDQQASASVVETA